MSESTTNAKERSCEEEVTYSDQLIFWLNGSRVQVNNPDPATMLTEYLRKAGYTGTKVVCEQGGCGACTVMVSHRDPVDGTPVHRAINACLKPVCAVDGMAVTTTEGIGNVHDGLDPTQYCIAKFNGTQCGFCTPGFVMNTHALLQQNPEATQQDIEDSFGGNLCRCTGYRPILHAMRTLAKDYDESNDQTQNCIVDPCFNVQCKPGLTQVKLDELPSHELPARELHFTGQRAEWFRPSNLEQAQNLKKRFSKEYGKANVKLVVGNTASGIYHDEKPRIYIDLTAVRELAEVRETNDGIVVGAAAPIQEMLDFVGRVIAKRSPDETRGLQELKRHGAFVAGYQVRSAGSVAGNIFMTRDHAEHGGPFPSDIFTVFGALGVSLTIASAEFDGGKKTCLLTDMPAVSTLPDDAVILSFLIPFTRQREYVQTYRIARRVQMAHPVVNAGLRVSLDEKGNVLSGGGLHRIWWLGFT